MRYLFISISFLILISCKKIINQDTDTSIYISDDIIINDRVKIRDTIFNYNTYEKFIIELVNSNRFIFVPLNEFEQTYSSEKIVIAMRHDIDYNIASAVRFARREYKIDVRATYYFLNTADYYSSTKSFSVIRNPSVLTYMKKLQNEYNHEIGWHNDLVTLQVVYNIDVKKYLTGELAWLRMNGIKIDGTVYHGSEYCYTYNYLNSYLWEGAGLNTNFPNYDSVLVDGIYKRINKFKLSDFEFKYEAGLLNCNYFFADVFFFDNKRWNMGMFDWNSLKPGDRVIVLTHPALWD
ncbi:MAG: hypothetical protein NT144_13295 [Bacteroidia bacterium]|nr:hypothetical protein [Bacteroidia bacterium]